MLQSGSATALMMAVERDQLEVVEALLRHPDIAGSLNRPTLMVPRACTQHEALTQYVHRSAKTRRSWRP
jgi:hypothetical protein